MASGTRHLPADERRALTVEAVIELAAEQPPSDITTGAIAERMELTQAALFRHFPSKDAIWAAVMKWVGARLLATVERAAQSTVTPLGALEAMFMAHIDFVERHPGVPRILFGELQRSERTPAKRLVQTLVATYGERIAAVVDEGKSRGEVAPEVDTAAAATLFIGTIQGLVMASLLAGDVKRIRGNARGAFAIYLRGIRRAR